MMYYSNHLQASRPLCLTITIFGLLLCGISGTALAQTSKAPLEITASDTLEWHRTEKLYIARGSAIAKQGTTQLMGDVLTASYKDSTGKGGIKIDRIDAKGNVRIKSATTEATGGQGFYDLKGGYAELTGANLSLKTPTDIVTARDKITYNANANTLSAAGNARAVRGDDVITADTLTGTFIKDASGTSKIDTLKAIGNVTITTPTDVLTGNTGTYDAKTNIAIMVGNVQIKRGPNLITGARGEVDLNTNISRIFGGSDTGTGTNTNIAPDSNTPRVRGVFYPE